MSTPETRFDDLVRNLSPRQLRLFVRCQQDQYRRAQHALRDISRGLSSLYDIQLQIVNLLHQPSLESVADEES
jgi:hypothetical protein